MTPSEFGYAMGQRVKRAGSRWRTAENIQKILAKAKPTRSMHALSLAKRKLGLPEDNPGIEKLWGKLPVDAEITQKINGLLPHSGAFNVTSPPTEVYRGFAGPAADLTDYSAFGKKTIHASPHASYANTYGRQNGSYILPGRSPTWALAKYPATPQTRYGGDGAAHGRDDLLPFSLRLKGRDSVPASEMVDTLVTGQPSQQYLVTGETAKSLPSNIANSVLKQFFTR